ncbi:hypothetical protein OG799_23135 [Micromonospora sp. NBC_00898]|uniref:DUF6745 domain-containing protein n=1 Tax=Micromonospora sp. NBC_00898 TaxID=2975981 RepID=UPI00386E0C8D|nr:hypothetical protein OG799_23135 [Micromonospora sp. NBC_00898]
MPTIPSGSLLSGRAYRCSPLTDLERSTLRPVLQAVRRTYDLVHSPIWSALDRHVTARYTMQPAWYWADDHGFVDQDDEARPLVRYSLPDLDDRFFYPAWCYYPDWVVLSAIDTSRAVLGAVPDLAWEGCREVALASGPWWPFADVAVMSERPTLLRINAQGQLHSDQGPAVTGPDGKQVWARDGAVTKVHP